MKIHLQENRCIFKVAIESTSVLRLLKNVEVNKARGIDAISGRFLKYGTDVLAFALTQICNLSIKLFHH